MKTTIVSQGPAHCYAAVGNVLITYYVGTPTAEPLRQREPWIVATLEQYQGVGLLVVIDARADGILPDSEFRQVSKAQAARYGPQIYCSVSAIEGDGIKYSLLRTFLRSLAVVVHAKFPVRFYTTAREAAAFTAQVCAEPNSPDGEQLLHALGEVRLQFETL